MKQNKYNWSHFLGRVLRYVMIMVGVLFLCTGCSHAGEEGIPIVVSYIAPGNTKIIEKTAYLKKETLEEQIEEVTAMLSTVPSKLEYQVPFSQGLKVKSRRMQGDTLILNVTGEYKNLTKECEILTRAAIVKSYTQIEGINKVTLLVNEEGYKDSTGRFITELSPDKFIDNSGEEISTYDKITIRLYFTDDTGEKLVAVDRTKAYNTNISLDKLVVEELLKGPETTTQGVYPTINANAKLISSYVKDNICYLNFDNTFLTQVNDVKAEIVIYSIVNSLCELPGIDRVQIYVDGKENVMFREVISLDTVFSRNFNYLEEK